MNPPGTLMTWTVRPYSLNSYVPWRAVYIIPSELFTHLNTLIFYSLMFFEYVKG